MRATVLFASPRGRESNTMALLRPALEGMRRWCRHTEMRWLGALSERHMGYGTVFMDGEKAAHAAAFAGELMARLTGASEEAAPARP